MKKPNLSIIMPMYNVLDIARNIKEVSKSLDSFIKNYEIILVNDGSTNGCYESAKKIKNRKLKLVGYKKNTGKGNAIKYGFNFAKGEYVAFLDCGQDLDPKQIKLFMRLMDEQKADIVVGSKRHPDSKVHYPLFRRIMSITYQIINNILFNLRIKDTQVGIKLFRNSALKKIMPKIAIKRFAFDLELLVIANNIGYKIIDAPIVMRYQFQSTVNSRAVFWILWDTAAIFYRLKILNYYD